MNDDLQQQLIKDLIIESLEGLDRFDQELLELEKGDGVGETMNQIFRIIHTIKGTSGCLGLSKIESVAHVGENLLSQLREGKIRSNSQIVSALLGLSDALREMFQSIEASGNEGSTDYSNLLSRLQTLQSHSSLLTTHVVQSQAFGLFEDEEPHTNSPPTPAAAPLSVSPPQIPTPTPANLEVPPPPPSTTSASASASEHGLHADDPNSEKHNPNRQSLTDSAIRVDVGQLDKLMNLVGELVLARNQIVQFSSHSKADALVAASQRLNIITTELQENVMKTRMQPIGNIWARFPRVVRDLSQELGKRVELVMDGNETELDRTIIESIKDPLTHLVRNAIDHGIETPEVRLASGKPDRGMLILRAFHEGGQVNIEIMDDGRGITVSKVKEKAITQGLLSSEQVARLSDRETFNLIFLPGFSTADKVTNVSGRGVGMDVVKTNIEKIGGSVDINSDAGKGTIIKIKIPLTLAIIPALIVTSAGQRFAIPQISLVELVRLEADKARKAIENIYGIPVYRLRGNLLPLAYLDQQLQIRSETSSQSGALERAVNIVILQADGRQFGVVVDRINDTEEIVVKPLGKQLKEIACFAGATIMGDGGVALIIDVMGLAQHSKVVSEAHDRAVTEEKPNASRADANRHTLLLFDVGASDRMAIPLSMVARLEEFPTSSIEHAGDQEVIQYRGELLPLIKISDHFPPRGSVPLEDPDTMQVVVYSDQGRSIGLVVGKINDIVEETTITRMSPARHGIRGTAVINNRVTTVLEAEDIIKAAAPSFPISGTQLY